MRLRWVCLQPSRRRSWNHDLCSLPSPITRRCRLDERLQSPPSAAHRRGAHNVTRFATCNRHGNRAPAQLHKADCQRTERRAVLLKVGLSRDRTHCQRSANSLQHRVRPWPPRSSSRDLGDDGRREPRQQPQQQRRDEEVQGSEFLVQTTDRSNFSNRHRSSAGPR